MLPVQKKFLKIVIAGLPNTGKSTLVKTLSELSVVNTDKFSPLEQRETTVAMDFGILQLSENYAIYLYGLPGQERFSFMREVIKGGVEGFIYLTEAGQKKYEEDLRHFKETIDVFKAPYVIGISKLDLYFGIKDIVEDVKYRLMLPDDENIYYCDPRDRDSSKQLLVASVEKILISKYRIITSN